MSKEKEQIKTANSWSGKLNDEVKIAETVQLPSSFGT